MSPTSAKLEMLAITRRMILPERVFGMSVTIHTFFGRAIDPISFVPSRCPAKLITSSTRPRIRK